MVEYGDPKGLSAMARTVGIPAGIAAKLILEGTNYIDSCYINTSHSDWQVESSRREL